MLELWKVIRVIYFHVQDKIFRIYIISPVLVSFLYKIEDITKEKGKGEKAQTRFSSLPRLLLSKAKT